VAKRIDIESFPRNNATIRICLLGGALNIFVWTVRPPPVRHARRIDKLNISGGDSVEKSRSSPLMKQKLGGKKDVTYMRLYTGRHVRLRTKHIDCLRRSRRELHGLHFYPEGVFLFDGKALDEKGASPKGNESSPAEAPVLGINIFLLHALTATSVEHRVMN